MSCIYIVGLGPGNKEHRTAAAEKAIMEADLLVAYKAYLEMVSDLAYGKRTFASSMMEEVKRADYAISEARAGNKVAVLASGDACVYGIGGLVLERMSESDIADIPVTIISGITAANSAASLVGAPLMNDYMVLSLSDLLTERSLLLRRVKAAAESDIVLSIYNPRSTKRVSLILEAINILLEYRSANVPVAIIRNAMRDEQQVTLCTLGTLEAKINMVDMFSTVIIGNSSTIYNGRFMITPRGYNKKYD